VCVEFSILFDIVRAEENCKWGQKFESVIGFGNARLVEDADEKRRALDIIMDHYGGKGGDYPDKKLKLTAVIEVVLTGMTGKGSV